MSVGQGRKLRKLKKSNFWSLYGTNYFFDDFNFLALRTKVIGTCLLQEEEILKNRPFVDFRALRNFSDFFLIFRLLVQVICPQMKRIWGAPHAISEM